ncbi:TonB-dependent receptor domain-containing protein [Pontixanthobacter aquaemixtae]|uniref:TonB-dependent receptor n=1 Tax=Pontixanthobacter aquaemixtae TaxID=1958940 RepID=A0A844ZSH8_9SPHN|nr:TonB-dependent receptor [Pontixanthobacter aquaemixtae]MXO89956.1 TonB-dependent receptor [Pontixanthobacter aquaemixtae]
MRFASKFKLDVRSALMTGGAAIALASTSAAHAQDADSGEEAVEGSDANNDEDIVVIGTLIRGIEVAGSQPILVSQEDLVERGATTTNELLSLVPQITNTFNGRFEGDPRGVRAGISINRPNLRNLPNFNNASGGTTLVLMDGHRITPVGVGQASIDADVIPAAVLAGIDVTTDGGSSLYGADAVAGVINFRTMRSFDGVKVDANYALGATLKEYEQYDGSITVGKDWGTGNAYFNVGYYNRDIILNGDTDFANGLVFDPTTGVGAPIGTECRSPVGVQVGYFFFGAGYTTNPAAPGAGPRAVGTPCDQVVEGTYQPKQERTNFFGSFTQELSDKLEMRVTGYWVDRDTEIRNYPLGYTTRPATFVPPAVNPPIGSVILIDGGTGFSFGPHASYVDRPVEIGLETWGITPTFKYDIGASWQLNTVFHYGESINTQVFPDVNRVAAQAAVDSGALDPQNVAAASPDVIANILDFENAQRTRHSLFVGRAIADGPLIELPAGPVSAAIGVEYQSPIARVQQAFGSVGSVNSTAPIKASRETISVFGELSVPVTDFLTIAGSLRYDDYSDFGSTTNPSIGFTFEPTDWIQIFGNFNTSFNAPTPLDSLPLSLGRIGGFVYDLDPGLTNPSSVRPDDPLGRDNGLGTLSLLLEGPGNGLRPQTAQSWAVGFEATPTPGFRFGGEYYSIDFDDVLGVVDVTNISTYTLFPQFYYYNSDVDGPGGVYDALVSQLANEDVIRATIPAGDVALLVDRRINNLNSAKLEGIDFHANFDTTTGLGEVSLGVAGNVQLKADLIASGVLQDNLGLNAPEFVATAFTGLRSGGFSGKLTVNYSGKFTDGGFDFQNNPVTIDPYVTANLFLSYSIDDGAGPLNGTTFRLNVDNIFDEQPDYIMRNSNNFLSYNGFSLGTVVRFGISKEF